jgi:hypothetical protein
MPALETFASKIDDGFARSAAPSLRALDWAANGGRFLRPTSLAELLALKRRFPEARLVAGATEIGVEVNKKFARFPAADLRGRRRRIVRPSRNSRSLAPRGGCHTHAD